MIMFQESLIFTHKNIRAERLSPVIKWAGGKETELKYILPDLPSSFERYFEPFVGGVLCFSRSQAMKCLLNDKSSELMLLYKLIKEVTNVFLKSLRKLMAIGVSLIRS